MDLSSSGSLFSLSAELSDPNFSHFSSVQGRLRSAKALLEACLLLPFALLCKSYRTLLKALGVAFSLGILVLTLGAVDPVRAFFVRRVTDLAQDLADWVLFPLAVLCCFVRMVGAMLIHPVLYFKH